MRRKDREVTEQAEIARILDGCKTCHLAMADGGTPYVVPLSYAYTLENGVLTLFFHSAREGRKLDVLKKNRRVCFEVCREGRPVFAAESPCNSGYDYSSVLGFGEASFLEDPAEKCAALSLLMRHQAGIGVSFTDAQAETVCVFRVVSTEFTGKCKPAQTPRD